MDLLVRGYYSREAVSYHLWQCPTEFTLVEALNCKDVILITSHLHMYRASRTFKAIFPERDYHL